MLFVTEKWGENGYMKLSRKSLNEDDEGQIKFLGESVQADSMMSLVNLLKVEEQPATPLQELDESV